MNKISEMTNNEKRYWITAIAKAIVFVIMTVLIILLTLEIQNNGFNIHSTLLWIYSISLVIISIIYICLETSINFLIKNS
jgi:uncharacterized membrane protein YhaH (DUF805 family)